MAKTKHEPALNATFGGHGLDKHLFVDILPPLWEKLDFNPVSYFKLDGGE